MSGLVAAEVRDLDRAVRRDETVPGSQVSVNIAANLEVMHRGRDL